jgi:hypothetical protein
MPYYNDNSAVSETEIIKRTIASENDVKTLIYIAGRSGP